MKLALIVLLGFAGVESIAPKFSWDYVGNLTFFHGCNESGLFNDEALETITRFPFVTIEKGQGYNDGSKNFAEEKIIAQCAAVKAIDPSICTVFYMNAVLSWYFYKMDKTYQTHPEEWLHDKKTGKPLKLSGDKHFDPPKDGMLVFNHANADLREFWKEVCSNATASGVVDGCFSDSSCNGTHGTSKHLNASTNAAFEAGKVQTMAEVTSMFGGQAGKAFKGSDGVLIGKKSYQQGINAYQIEFFEPNEASILELKAGASRGWLVQAHVGVKDPVSLDCGCACMNDTMAAFLIGAGPYSYYGSGQWIAADLKDVQQRWCPPLFDRPLGVPLSDGTKGADGVWRRKFKSGTSVEFDPSTSKGTIDWRSN